MNVVSICLLAASAFLFSSCAGTPPTAERKGFYGNFCGPNHPKVPDDFGKEEQLFFLSNILPKDDIDAACQRHDLCYAVFGYFTAACNYALLSDLSTMNFSPEISGRCDNIRTAIHTLFDKIPFERDPNVEMELRPLDLLLEIANPETYLTLLGDKPEDERCENETPPQVFDTNPKEPMALFVLGPQGSSVAASGPALGITVKTSMTGSWGRSKPDPETMLAPSEEKILTQCLNESYATHYLAILRNKGWTYDELLEDIHQLRENDNWTAEWMSRIPDMVFENEQLDAFTLKVLRYEICLRGDDHKGQYDMSRISQGMELCQKYVRPYATNKALAACIAYYFQESM